MAKINFFVEDIDFNLPHPRKISKWIQQSILKEKHSLKELNFIFCSDQYLSQINLQYLNHATLTDIVTFDNSEAPGTIEGDVFISIPRVSENAIKFRTTFDSELRRVIVHGVLHLTGHSDKTKKAKEEMRKAEDEHLSLYK